MNAYFEFTLQNSHLELTSLPFFNKSSAMKAQQDFLPGLNIKPQRSFGGSHLKSHPKGQRAVPLDRPLHLVMRSRLANGKSSFRQKYFAERIFGIIQKQCERFNVRLYQYGNGGNHIHLMVMPRSRRGYCGFIRAITGLIARLILRAQKSQPKNLKFWDARPFSRVVVWGKDFRQLGQYLIQNTLEAFGFIEHQPRGRGAGYDREWRVKTAPG